MYVHLLSSPFSAPTTIVGDGFQKSGSLWLGGISLGNNGRFGGYDDEGGGPVIPVMDVYREILEDDSDIMGEDGYHHSKGSR